MGLFKAGVCSLAICQVILAQAPPVTDTALVNAGKGQEVLRKINGRWWSQDNREGYPPSKDRPVLPPPAVSARTGGIAPAMDEKGRSGTGFGSAESHLRKRRPCVLVLLCFQRNQ